MGGCEASDGHAIRAAGNVVDPDLVTEVDRLWVAAVLTTETELEIASSKPAVLNRHSHERSHAIDI